MWMLTRTNAQPTAASLVQDVRSLKTEAQDFSDEVYIEMDRFDLLIERLAARVADLERQLAERERVPATIPA